METHGWNRIGGAILRGELTGLFHSDLREPLLLGVTAWIEGVPRGQYCAVFLVAKDGVVLEQSPPPIKGSYMADGQDVITYGPSVRLKEHGRHDLLLLDGDLIPAAGVREDELLPRRVYRVVFNVEP